MENKIKESLNESDLITQDYKIKFIDDIEEIFEEISRLFPKSTFLILTDDNIHRIYYKKLESIIASVLRKPYIYIIQHGENNKNRFNKEKVENYLCENNFERDDVIIALG